MGPIDEIVVGGEPIDDECRCVHYRSILDVVAVRFPCCDPYYPCFRCHDEGAGHARQRWTGSDAEERAILCGSCRRTMAVGTYREASACPGCGHAFNPGCRLHEDLYFDDRPHDAL